MVYKELTQLLLKQSHRLTWSSLKCPHVLTRFSAQTPSTTTTACFCTTQHLDLNLRQQARLYSQDTTIAGVNQNLNPTGVEKKKLEKKPAVVKILLINETGNFVQTTLEDATKIARKKGLLLRLDTSTDHKHKDKVYKLETNAQHYGSDWKKSGNASADKEKSRKEEKTIILKSRITEHDALAKVKQIVKLVEKGIPVRVFIGQSGSGDSDSVFKLMEANLKGPCQIQQKVSKGGEIRFKVVQSKEELPADSTESVSETTDDTLKK